MKHLFIINPAAGKMNVTNVAESIEKECHENNIKPFIVYTTKVGDATRLAHEFAIQYPDSYIYSVGGDGTLNEVVNGMANTNATVGVLPFGSGNDFFRMLSDHKDNIITRTINGDVVNVNMGKINDRYFFNSTSIGGLDTTTIVNIPAMKNSKFKLIRDNIYMASLLYSIATFDSPEIKISFHDKVTSKDINLNQKITILAICNGIYYGNDIPVSPKADIYDNLFNICLADKVSRPKIFTLLPKVQKGRHENFPFVHTYQTDHMMVESSEPLNCNVDGDLITSDKFEISMGNNIKVLKPRK